MLGFYTPSSLGGWLLNQCFLARAAVQFWTNSKTWTTGSPNRDRLSRCVIIGVMLPSFALAVCAASLYRLDLDFPGRSSSTWAWPSWWPA